MEHLRVDVDSGKYTVVYSDEEGLVAYRYGDESEPWRNLLGDNLIYCLAYELDEARKALGGLESPLK